MLVDLPLVGLELGLVSKVVFIMQMENEQHLISGIGKGRGLCRLGGGVHLRGLLLIIFYVPCLRVCLPHRLSFSFVCVLCTTESIWEGIFCPMYLAHLVVLYLVCIPGLYIPGLYNRFVYTCLVYTWFVCICTRCIYLVCICT